MIERYQHAARVALSLAGIDAAAQARVLDALPIRLDRIMAMERRNGAIREAHRLVRPPTSEPNRRGARSTPAILARDLNEFHARAWPHLRHLAAPPDDASPLRRAYFFACQAAEDAGEDMPGERQVRRIIS